MILLILILIFSSNNLVVLAVDNSSCYARIMFDQVYLYKTPNDNNDVSNIYFELPRTYFVELTNKHGDFYQANYKNLTGYVKKESVQAVVGTPQNPFLNNITFRVYSDLSCNLKSNPNSQSNQVTKIPVLTKNISYIGKINGDCLIEGRTNTWFYCKYSADKDYYGYVYSDFCDQMPAKIPNNIENMEYTPNPTFEIIPTPIKTIPENNKYVTIIIAVLSIPALIFMFMIMKGTRFFNKENVQGKEIIDY